MADFQQFLSHGLLSFLCPKTCTSVMRLDFECARHLLLHEHGFFSMQASIPPNALSLEDVTLVEGDHSGYWQELQAVLNSHSVGLPIAGTHSVASLIKIASTSGKELARELVFQMAAVAEKDRGNSFFKACSHEKALASYSRAMALLGLLSAKIIADGTTEASASLDLSVSLCNNRSLCFLKLGRTLPAMKDAEKALGMLGGHGKNIAAWSKAMHRLASACTRAGLFKEAGARLDTIEKATRSRAATAELRQVLRSLRENCSVACSGHKFLLDHLKERRAGLSEALDASDVAEAWFVIREHFASFPLLFLLDMPELRQRCRKLPGKMLNLMAMIQRSQDPLNPYTGGKMTEFNVEKLRSMIEGAYLQTENERKRRQSLLELANSTKRAFPAEQIAEELGVDLEEHPDQEEVHQQLILLMRWVLAYLELDDFQFDAARESLHRLIFHVTVHPKAAKYFPDHINRLKSPMRTDFKNPYVAARSWTSFPSPSGTWLSCFISSLSVNAGGEIGVAVGPPSNLTSISCPKAFGTGTGRAPCSSAHGQS